MPPTKQVASAKVQAKVVHLYSGLELIGSKTSINTREADMEVTPIGMHVVSRKTKRAFIVPWSNVKGVELLPTSKQVVQDSE